MLAEKSAFYHLSQKLVDYVSKMQLDPSDYANLLPILQLFPGNVLFKDAKFHYTLVNQGALDNYACRHPQELIGNSIYDMAKKMGTRWPKYMADEVNENELTLAKSGTPMIAFEEFPYLNAQNKLVALSLTKVPILHPERGFQGMLIFALNTIDYHSAEQLRHLYSQIYQDKKIALERFLVHIGLEKYNKQHSISGKGISNRELDCLILLARGKTHKAIALQLNLSTRTVQTHLNNIKLKLGYYTTNEMIDDFFSHYYERHRHIVL